MVTEKLEAVELNNLKKVPACADVRVGTVKALNPVFVNLHNPPEFALVKVNDVADTSVVIARYSVGLTNRILFVADNWKL